MRTFAGAVPLSVLGVVVTIVIAVALSPALARWLQTRRAVAGLVVFGFGLVLAATLMPTAAALDGDVGSGVCDVSRVGPASIEELTNVTLASLNVLLFVPLGVAVGLLPRTRAALVVTVAAISLTFVVEAIQLIVTPLGRGCQTADLVDNLMGLAIGIVIGALARPLLRSLQDRGA